MWNLGFSRRWRWRCCCCCCCCCCCGLWRRVDSSALSMLLRNVGIFLWLYTASWPTRLTSSFSETDISSLNIDVRGKWIRVI
jgi:hypothetical protein